jgi:hypothetical protein
MKRKQKWLSVKTRISSEGATPTTSGEVCPIRSALVLRLCAALDIIDTVMSRLRSSSRIILLDDAVHIRIFFQFSLGVYVCRPF